MNVGSIVWFFVCSMFCCTLLCVLSSFFNHLDGEERAGCFTLYVFLVHFVFFVALLHDAVGWSAVSDHPHFFHNHPFFKDLAKEWDRGYNAISRT